MRRRILFGCLATAILSPWRTMQAQVTASEPRGSLEVIGLRRWTMRMLEDSVAAKSDGVTLQSHACAAVLQEKLGFPAAAVSILMNMAQPGQPPTMQTLITLVEPQDSARVQFRPLVGHQTLTSREWLPLRRAATDTTGLRVNQLLFAMQFYTLFRQAPDSASALVKQYAPEMHADSRAIWTAISRHRSAADFVTSQRIIRSDTSWQHRALAVAVLANFASHDVAWHALVGALRDPEERVRSTAGAVLRTLSERPVRRVNWRPAEADLRALIGGTNLWDYGTLLTVLAKTGVQARLASPLLHDNADMLLAHLRANDLRAKAPALALVRQLAARASLSHDEAIAWTAAQ